MWHFLPCGEILRHFSSPDYCDPFGRINQPAMGCDGRTRPSPLCGHSAPSPAVVNLWSVRRLWSVQSRKTKENLRKLLLLQKDLSEVNPTE